MTKTVTPHEGSTTPNASFTRPAEPAGPYRYVISGLRVQSEIQLPSAIQQDEDEGAIEIVLESGDVPREIAGAERGGKNWQARGGDFLLMLPTVGLFLITDGTRIVFAAEPSIDPNDVALYLLGTCFAILLQQRKRLVLHASAVVVDHRAMLFSGPSGSGKSTIAAALCRRGYALLNDDVCSLSLGADGRFVVHPDGRMLKLWSASIDYLEQGEQATEPVRAGFAKFYSTPRSAASSACPVHSVYLLNAVSDGVAPGIRRLSLAEGMSAIQGNAFRPELVSAMGQTEAYFNASALLQRTARLFELSRPLNFAAAERTLDLLEEQWMAEIHGSACKHLSSNERQPSDERERGE